MKTVIIFAKTPQVGKVKTRLFRDTALDAENACALYSAFLRDAITMTTLTTADKIAIHYTPPEDEAAIKKIVKSLKLGARNDRRITFAPQTGETFTERISRAFTAEKGAEAIAMIGADSPLLQPDSVDDALDFIDNRQGFALGPSGEGGLYLIGHPGETTIDYDTLFTEGSEFENFFNEAKKQNMPLKILSETLDVDLESDLVTLIGLVRAMEYSRQFDGFFLPAHTVKAVEELRLTVVRDSGDTRDKKVAKG